MNSTYSNNRQLTFTELILALTAANIPAFDGEPKEITRLRCEGEAQLITANQIPGTIIDSLPYVYLKLAGKIHD